MKKNIFNRILSAAIALLILLPALPLGSLAMNPILNVTYASGFTVYRYTEATADAQNGEKISDRVIDLSDQVHFMTGNNVQMGGLCLWPVEGDELPPATICNSGYNGKEYSSDLLALWQVSSSSLMAGTILGKTVGYDWDTGKFYANEGYTLRYTAAGELYPEPGTYRFLMFYSNYVYYSDVYTITDNTDLTANQGVADVTWVVDDHPASVVPFNVEENKASFDLSILLPADVEGIGSVRLLRADYDMFASDSYYWFGVNVPGDSFQVGSFTDEGVSDEGRCFLLENCEIAGMRTGSYRVKIVAGDGRIFVDNTVAVVKEVSSDPPVITTSSLPDGKVDVPYSATLEATPVSGGAITWTLSGKLPDGLTLSPDGVISGTPTKEGEFTFAVRASEDGGGFAEKQYTVTIAEPDLAISDDGGYFWYNDVGEQIKFGSTYSVSTYFNRAAHSDETASATIYYTSVGGAQKTIDHTLEMKPWANAYAEGKLPDDAARVDRVEYFLNGDKVYEKTVGKSVAPALDLTVTGSSAQYLYMNIYDEAGACVKGYSLGREGRTFNVDSLPSGTYRIMLSGTLGGFGYQNYGELTVTLEDGVRTAKTLPIVEHYATRIELDAKAEGEHWCYATFDWYADAEGTEKLQSGTTRTLLDDEAVYVRANPYGSTTVTNLQTDLIRIDRDGVTSGYRRVEITLPRKATATVNVSVLREQLDGGAPALGYHTINVTKYGSNGYSSSHTYYPNWREGAPFELTDLTEGSLITVSGDTGWGSVSYTVTAEDTASGAVDVPLTVPLADGLFRWSVTLTDSEGTRPFWNLSYLDQVRIRKADGTDLPFIRRNEFLLLTDPDAVSVGETLTVVGWRGDAEFPYGYGEALLTVTEENGRRTGEVVLPIISRARAYCSVDRGEEMPAITALVYGADGNLIYQQRNVGANSYAREIGVNTPYLPAGYYFVGFAPTVYLDGLDPEDYDTAAELALTPYSVVSSTDAVIFNNVNLGTLELPTGFRGTQMINLDLSGVSMNKEESECFRLDVTVTTKTGFAWDRTASHVHRNVTLYIKTNQSGTNSWGGHVSTRSLSVNGHPVDIDRWGENGTLRDDGSITLTLTPEMIDSFGGFPLKVSTTCYQSVDDSLEAKAYLRYWTPEGVYHSDFVGEFSAPTGALTLTAPKAVTDGSFTVYGRGPVSLSGDPYKITLFLDGEPVASGMTDNKRGYYRINVNLDEDALSPLRNLRFTAAGSYLDGVRAYTSEEQVTLYNPEGAQVQTMVLSWESHQGDFEAGRGQSIVMLNDGDAPNLYGLWYRGGNSNDLARVFWTVTFDGHPEKVEAVRVYVPRNGYTDTLECIRQPDGSWATEPKFFIGYAPDGAWVEFDCPVEYGYVNDPDSSFSNDDVAEFLTLLSGSEDIYGVEGDPLNGDVLTFLLGDPEEGQLPVGFSIWEEEWDGAELERFKALELDAATPNLLSYDEGYKTFGEGEEAFTVWATDTVYRYVDHDDNTKHLYEETIYTPDFRMVTTWNESTGTKQVSILSIGALGYEDIDFDGIEDETLRDFARTAAVQDIWMIFYEQFAYAIADAVEGAGETTSAISNVTVSSVAKSRGPSPQEIVDGIKRLDKIRQNFDRIRKDPYVKLIGDSYGWCHGREISSYDIRQIKDFLDDNPCLKRLYKFYRSATDDANNPYHVIAEADAVYYKLGMSQLGKIVKNAFTAGSAASGTAKQAAQKLTDAMYKGTVETLADNWYMSLWEADLFANQSENLAHEIYLAAKRAEREERGPGGLCSEGINWRRFPTRLYDYNRYFGYGPHSYTSATPPPGPQGRYDPSGYVYEAVPSNRVDGATVTLRQLEGATEVTDGDGNAVSLTGGVPYIVDAELFGIEPNPQTTGADGRYQWFVPTGWWRVTVEKAGYEGADTGTDGGFGIGAVRNGTDGFWYMPVLPEQLDVNIPIVSYSAPAVEKIVANTKGIFAVFTKYMDEETLTADRFTLIVNGGKTAFTMSLVDSEKSGSAEDAPSYTRTVKLTYDGMKAGDTVELVIDNSVESYAGVAMETRAESGRMTVTAPETAATPVSNLPSGEVEPNTPIFISAPAEGTVVRYTVDGSDPTEDSPVLGDAIIITEETTVKAIATGALVAPSEVLTVRFTVPAKKTAPARVTAEVDGVPVNDCDTVDPGRLTLSCATEGAEILYTLNGVCPCDDETARFVYSGPIDLEPGEYYFRIRALKDGVWSEGLPLHLTVRGPADPCAGGHDLVRHAGKAATCTKEGYKAYDTCSRCDYTTYEEIPALGHDFGADGNAGKCARCGAKNPGYKPPVSFEDVPDDAYYAEPVNWAVANGVTQGISATKFGPDNGCTRGQVVTFLWRSAGSPEPKSAKNPFADVNEGDYYYKAVLWAVENGITAGTGKTTFSPGSTCTRGQIVTFLWRANGEKTPKSSSNPFGDVSESDYFFKAVLWAVENNVTKGTSATAFSPNATCTRAQVVTFLYRATVK